MNVVAFILPRCWDHPEIGITAALAQWSTWSADIAPTGSTGDDAQDRRLADAFRALVELPTMDARLRWIEAAVFSTSDFVPVSAPADPYRETLMRWWLDIFKSE